MTIKRAITRVADAVVFHTNCIRAKIRFFTGMIIGLLGGFAFQLSLAFFIGSIVAMGTRLFDEGDQYAADDFVNYILGILLGTILYGMYYIILNK